jgi:hypothetical protein
MLLQEQEKEEEERDSFSSSADGAARPTGAKGPYGEEVRSWDRRGEGSGKHAAIWWLRSQRE